MMVDLKMHASSFDFLHSPHLQQDLRANCATTHPGQLQVVMIVDENEESMWKAITSNDINDNAPMMLQQMKHCTGCMMHTKDFCKKAEHLFTVSSRMNR